MLLERMERDLYYGDTLAFPDRLGAVSHQFRNLPITYLWLLLRKRYAKWSTFAGSGHHHSSHSSMALPPDETLLTTPAGTAWACR